MPTLTQKYKEWIATYDKPIVVNYTDASKTEKKMWFQNLKKQLVKEGQAVHAEVHIAPSQGSQPWEFFIEVYPMESPEDDSHDKRDWTHSGNIARATRKLIKQVQNERKKRFKEEIASLNNM